MEAKVASVFAGTTVECAANAWAMDICAFLSTNVAFVPWLLVDRQALGRKRWQGLVMQPLDMAPVPSLVQVACRDLRKSLRNLRQLWLFIPKLRSTHLQGFNE